MTLLGSYPSWAALATDWRLALLAAGLLNAATRDEAGRFLQVLARYRDARISFLGAMEGGGREASASGEHPEIDRAIAEELDVLVAIALGVVVGSLWPGVGVAMEPIGTAFVGLS